MHIGFLTPEYPDAQAPEGGLGNYTRKVALELVGRGHRVTIFVMDSGHRIVDDAGIEVYFVTRFKFHWRFKINPFIHEWLDLCELWLNASRIRRAVLAYHRIAAFDIVQTSNYMVPGYSLFKNKLFPLVCRCSSYPSLLRSANGVRRKLTDSIADWMETRLVFEADAAFAPSQMIASTYERFEAVKPCVIRTPVELPTRIFDDSIYHALVNGRKYILYFGALNGIKGVDVLIQTARGILNLDKNLALVFIGRNDPLPDGVRALAKIQSELADLLQERRVIYSNSLPKSQLYPIIRNSFGVVLPSRVDNFPNACLEAFSLGVPVIGTRHSSLDEMIVDGKTGYLAENGDSLSLQAAVSKLFAQTSEERIEMIRAIHQTVETILNEDRVGILLQFYQNVIVNFSNRS